MNQRGIHNLPSYETLPLAVTVKKSPVCKMVLLQLSPSIPTQILAEYGAEPPDGMDGEGTMIVPVTEV